jgi:hypothetical protein
MLLLFDPETSGYQCQDRIKHPQQLSVYFLGVIQMLFHILQGVKASTKRNLIYLLLTH